MAKKRNYASAFQTDLITLLVGPDEEKFTIHQAIISKVRYFAGCLESTLQESHTKIIKLPEDEPAVIAKVLGYLYSGTFEVATFEGKTESESEEERLQNLIIVKTYIVADKYCMETFQNTLMDLIKGRRPARSIMLSALAEANLFESPLARYLLRLLARQLFKYGYEKGCSTNGTLQDLIKQNGLLAQELVKTCVTFGSTRELGPLSKMPDCEWHVHSDGEKCQDLAK